MNTELDNDTAFNINDFNEFTEKKLYLDVLKNINFEQAVNYLFNYKLYSGLEYGLTIDLNKEIIEHNMKHIELSFILFIYSVVKHKIKNSKNAYKVYKEFVRATCTEEEINSNDTLKMYNIDYDDLDDEFKSGISQNFILMKSFL